MKRKIIAIVLIALILCAACCVFAGCENCPGEFHSLKQAYDIGWLTQDDLKSIAYHYGNRDENYKPIPIDEISKDIQFKIKQTYVAYLREQGLEGTVNNVRITKFYGEYSGHYVINVVDDLHGYDYVFTDENIGGVMFYHYCVAAAVVWKSNNI